MYAGANFIYPGGLISAAIMNFVEGLAQVDMLPCVLPLPAGYILFLITMLDSLGRMSHPGIFGKKFGGGLLDRSRVVYKPIFRLVFVLII
jgi:hypothetical protein